MTDTVARLRQLEAAATPGQWRLADNTTSNVIRAELPKGRLTVAHLRTDVDAELVTAARNALPALLDIAEAVERMRDADTYRARAAAVNDYDRFVAAEAQYVDAWDATNAALAALDSQDESGTSAA